MHGDGVKSVVAVTVNSKEETLKTFVPITSKNSASAADGMKRGIRNKKIRLIFAVFGSDSVPMLVYYDKIST